MVTHIVFWKVSEQNNGESKEQIMLNMKRMLENLIGEIPGLLKLETGIDQSRRNGSYDFCLTCQFPDWESLQVYQNHPKHVACKEYIGAVTLERALCDYETL